MTKNSLTLHVSHADGSINDIQLNEEIEYIIGRKPGKLTANQEAVPLQDPFASRNHCRIFMVHAQTSTPLSNLSDQADDDNDATLLVGAHTPPIAAGWHVEDLHSANGTQLNKQTLSKASPIPPQGIIRIGSSEITLIHSNAITQNSSPTKASVAQPLPTVTNPPPAPSPQTIQPSTTWNASPPHWTATNQPSTADELQKLAELRSMGILTDAEFQIQKQRLLNLPPLSGSPVMPTSTPSSIHEQELLSGENNITVFVVEAGTFSRNTIQEAQKRIQSLNLPILRRFINIENTIFYLLHIGPYTTETEAMQVADKLQKRNDLEDLPGYGQYRVAPVQELTRAEGRFDKRRPIQAGWPGIH